MNQSKGADNTVARIVTEFIKIKKTPLGYLQSESVIAVCVLCRILASPSWGPPP